MNLTPTRLSSIAKTVHPMAGLQVAERALSPQRFLNGEVHDWYRIILGYSDHLVSMLLDRFDVQTGDLVLDPFCGTGTTLIECMKRDIQSVGLEVNPSSAFAARVKTHWGLNVGLLLVYADELKRARGWVERRPLDQSDDTYEYLENSGMLERRWISPSPLRRAISIKKAITKLKAAQSHKDFFTLALLAVVVRDASNVKFGPELYCGPTRRGVDVFGAFVLRVESMIGDIAILPKSGHGLATVNEADARKISRSTVGAKKFRAVISSPPYPAEHDYTRNSRLELAFLGMISDRASLRVYKRQMIRSHTKGIYNDDNDSDHVRKNSPRRILFQTER